ncbi:restriction endonuclease subunit S [Priestia megaterium]|uniref:restriction endonuclease subunit S n=1 Tax=Priestia megaterium TaxID=1404 RepID=UPI00203EFBD6|nr:restriction endonuclease subunit S [Priestia megaterium]MCM3541750.1 restriction endonuclease subunit S [Priestia megaterium]
MNSEFRMPPVTIVHLSELVKIKKGKKVTTMTESSEGTVYPILKIDNLRGEVPKEFGYDEKGVLCSPHDILIVWDGTNAGQIGTNLQGYVGSTIAKMEIKNPKKIHYMYLYHFLKLKFGYLNQHAEGVAIKHLNRSKLLNLVLPLPSWEFQVKFVKILEKSSAVVKKEKNKLDLVGQLVQAVFQEVVGPLADGYEKWPKFSIDKLASNIRSGPFGSQLLHSEFTETGDVLVLGIENAVKKQFVWSKNERYITKEKYKKLNRYTAYPEDVLVTIMGTVGRAAVVPNNIPLAITTKHLATLTLKKDLVHCDFIAGAFNYHSEVIRQMNQLNRGAIMKGLSIGTIRQIQIHIPPMKVQLGFSRIVRQIRDIEKKMQNKFQVTETLYNTLAHNVYKVPTK